MGKTSGRRRERDREGEMKHAKKSSGNENQQIASVKSKPKRNAAKKKKIEERNKPKKPPTAFFFFLEDFRKVYQEEHPEVKSMRDIGKACGEKWKTMSFEEKVQYYDTATEKRAEFDRAMAEYKKRKETGGNEDAEESDYYE